MTAPMCPSCRGDSVDGLLCNRCSKTLRATLGELPALVAELEVSLTRQSKFGSRGEGKSATTPLPYDVRASEVLDDLMNTLTTWVRELDLGDGTPPLAKVRPLCGWLLHRMERIRMHPASNEITDEIEHSARSIRSAIDIPAPRVLAGTCPICDHQVYGGEKATVAVCRYCERGGINSVLAIDPAQEKRWLDATDKLVTRSIALDALAHLGRHVKPETFKSWVKRGAIVKHDDPTANGRVLYRLGDVLNLADERKKEPA